MAGQQATASSATLEEVTLPLQARGNHPPAGPPQKGVPRDLIAARDLQRVAVPGIKTSPRAGGPEAGRRAGSDCEIHPRAQPSKVIERSEAEVDPFKLR